MAPSAVNFSFLWTINGYNTRTGATYNVTTPTTTVMAYCGGGGASGDCPYGSSTTVTQQNGNFVWIFTATNTPPGGNSAFNNTPMQGYGCAVKTITNAEPVRVPIQNCPCVTSTCGQFGCPACPVCPTPNGTCNKTNTGGQPTVLQNVCNFPNNNGCPTQYDLALVGGSPCCVNPGTPIIMDVDGSGYSLTSAANGVMFDFYGDGTPARVAWIAPGSTNGWLVLDPDDAPVSKCSAISLRSPPSRILMDSWRLRSMILTKTAGSTPRTPFGTRYGSGRIPITTALRTRANCISWTAWGSLESERNITCLKKPINTATGSAMCPRYASSSLVRSRRLSEPTT